MKWYDKVNTWNKVILILSPMAGGEILSLFASIPLPNWVHVTFGVIGAFVLYLKMVVAVDKDGNGRIDIRDKQ